MQHPLIIFALHHKWRQLRRWHISSSVLVDYRILQNYAHRIIKHQEPKL